MNDIDTMLTDAGRRLRADAPDATTAAEVLDTIRTGGSPGPRMPRRWPMYVGGGLAAAALVGVFATTVVDRDEAIRTVPIDAPSSVTAPTVAVDTAPPSTDGALPDAPTVIAEAPVETAAIFDETAPFISAATFDEDCFRLTLSSAQPEAVLGEVDGCLPESFSTTLFARLDATVFRISIPEREFSTWLVDTYDDRGTTCGVVDLLSALPASSTSQRIACVADGDPARPSTIVQTTGTSPNDPTAGQAFVTPLFTDEPTRLAEIIVTGLPDGTLTYFDEPQSCLELISANRSTWRSICGLQPDRGALVMLDDIHLQIDRTEEGFVATELVDVVAPLTNGCSASDGREIVEFVLTGNSMASVSEIRCLGSRGLDDPDGARASVRLTPVLNQSGPHDGLQVTLQRSDGRWSVTDMGTAVGDFAPNPIPTFQRWTDLSSGTTPSPAQVGLSWSGEPASMVEWADVLLDGLQSAAATSNETSGQEFPTTHDVVFVAPDGLPLVVFSSSTGGDDSIEGADIYVWFNQGRYPDARADEQNFTGVYQAARCRRDVVDGVCL